MNLECDDDITNLPEPIFGDNCSTVGTPVYTEVTTQTASGYTIVRNWVVTDACGNFNPFSQTINVTDVTDIISVDDSSTPRCNDSNNAQVDLVTLLPTGTPTDGTWNTIPGLTGSVFNPFGVLEGNYVAAYTYNVAGQCPARVEITLRVIECAVIGCDNVIVHNAFTPNGDGTNEWFQIDNIEQTCHLPNSIEIYNRWGILVYEAKNYDNTTVKFVGISEGRATVSKSAELPAGTYFYILQYTDTTTGKTVSESKYLYLTR